MAPTVSFKGTVSRDFRPLFFHQTIPPGPLSRRLKPFAYGFDFAKIFDDFSTSCVKDTAEALTLSKPYEKGFNPCCPFNNNSICSDNVFVLILLRGNQLQEVKRSTAVEGYSYSTAKVQRILNDTNSL
jgi:hypothetical protein